ncbi:MAG TPA: hypothetical protein DHU55_19790 [Blastocatellia bacterium]|jgi:uncharacterized protein|nr:hypothetical protein [Blastocatellia bacterium]
MRIELANLEGPNEFAHEYAPGELVVDDERSRLLEGPSISGHIIRADRRINVNGRIDALLQVECDRCLKPVELPVKSEFKLEYVTAEDYRAQQAVELTEDDLDLSVFDGAVIDIDELVTEELLLAVPAQVLCKDNCLGICLVCGADRNQIDCGCAKAEVDPRWAGLKELVNGK